MLLLWRPHGGGLCLASQDQSLEADDDLVT